MTAEYLSTTHPDHVINIINRDQRTPIFEPEKWNENCTTVVVWVDGEGLLPSTTVCLM
jgi:hypothetical protein